MKTPTKLLTAAAVLLAFPFALSAQTTWTTVFHDSFSLGGARVAGGDPENLPVEESITRADNKMVMWRRNNTTAFGPEGGIVARSSGGVYGSGAAHLAVGFRPNPPVGPHFGVFDSGVLKVTASVTIGNLSPSGWVGIAFLGNPDAPWFPGSLNSNPLWVSINTDGWLTLQGTWLGATDNPNEGWPSVQVNALPGFSTTDPVELSLSYNLDTFGVEVYFNGQSIMSTYGLHTRDPDPASSTYLSPLTMRIMNGAGLYIEGSSSSGVLPTVHSLTVEHGIAIPEPANAVVLVGALSLMAGLGRRRRSARALV